MQINHIFKTVRNAIDLSRRRIAEGTIKRPNNIKPITLVEKNFQQSTMANIITPLPKSQKESIYIF